MVVLNAGVYNICEPNYDNWETAFQAYQSNKDLKDLISDRNAKEKEMENINPLSYKDNFTIPLTFDDAWNHPDPFQRKKWREAIGTEFQKMEQMVVWRKVL